jgi:pimeloyl-ACP methyl ester carboxylesterase
MSGFDLSENSTTVRSVFSRIQAISPALAAQLAAATMFRTRRKPRSDWESLVAERAEPLTIDGPSGSIAVQRWGQGPLVLLVHGWNGRGSQLGGFVEPLVEAGFQVVAFDAPGHGASAGSSSSLVHFANAFDAVVDAVRPFFQPIRGVIAHSMGGAAVMLALSRAQNQARVTTEPGAKEPRLVFIAPPIDLHDFVSTVSSELGLSPRTERVLASLVEERIGHRMADLQALRHAESMQAPLLVLHDEKDRAVPLACGESLVQAWPGAELRKSSGLGHNRILRDTATITTAVAVLASRKG